ncbi:MAG: tRNA (adenosine(37)-N6)-dimethylallyltransferase MiaA [Candidatus Promineifilaceae bacterium]|jgi:tRNA dimethylallyltransferase
MTKKGQNGKIGNLLVIVGPTAVGKTDHSLSLAMDFDGEIVSADSRLFYEGMDIGTAKPSIAERTAVPHYLIDICKPDQTLTLGEYQRLAYRTIEEILDRGRLPILVGGTGQYVMAVVEGWGIPEIAPYPELRRQLERLGPKELARWLNELDPLAAQRIDPRNMRRVVRALEVCLISGRPITDLQEKTPPPYNIHIIGLYRDRESLYQRIDRRVDAMIGGGLVEEVEALRDQGYRAYLPSMSGLGYRQILTYLRGEMSLSEAVDRIKFETHRFARQQDTWFRKDDPRITWFDLQEPYPQKNIFAQVESWLSD